MTDPVDQALDRAIVSRGTYVDAHILALALLAERDRARVYGAVAAVALALSVACLGLAVSGGAL